MMEYDAERVRANVQKAATEDLLDRATVYQAGMEPEALDIIEAELRRRGVTASEQEEHRRRREAEAVSPLPDGTALRCSFCARPAVRTSRGWHRLWGIVPLFPRRLAYCSEHLPKASAG